jgi:hypothetical protein
LLVKSFDYFIRNSIEPWLRLSFVIVFVFLELSDDVINHSSKFIFNDGEL